MLMYTWKVQILQELLNTRMNNLYVKRFDYFIITEMIVCYVMSNYQWRLFVQNFAYFSFVKLQGVSKNGE